MNPQAPISPNPMMPQVSQPQPTQSVALSPMASSAPGQLQPPPDATTTVTAQPSVGFSALTSAAPETANAEEDKAWITKAGEIIRTLQQDPFNESLELGKLKAAYLKARYGKDIKTGDDGRQ